jgi:hypothetical protein
MATGVFSTANFTTDHAAKSFAGMITRLMPNGSAPLFGLTSMLESETAVAIEHGFFTKTMLFPEMTLAAAVADGVATTFTVTSTANIMPGMIFRVDTTGENILVVTVVSATSITVARGVGTVAAAAIANSVKLYQVGNAYEEASNRPTAQQVQPVRITNYTQIFRNSWILSDTVRATKMIAGDGNVAESRQDCAAFHATAIETALFFGQKSSSTRNGQPFRTMDGLISIVGNLTYYPSSYAAANVTTLGATTNYTQLEAALDPVFNQATDPKVANERVLFVGGAAKRVLNNIGRLNGTYQLVDGQTSYGLQFSTFKTARGTFRMIEHPLFNTNSTWSKMAVAVDLSTFRIAYLGDRKTKNEEFGINGDVPDSGMDAVGGTLTTELTCVIKNPPANAVLYNFTAAQAG